MNLGWEEEHVLGGHDFKEKILTRSHAHQHQEAYFVPGLRVNRSVSHMLCKDCSSGIYFNHEGTQL